ncbi:bifunctional prephenate dehydrogenase/3-phosphoshikimate 1-carboxyvinyltransferase [Sansalvadorimonas verongulae]|uniref:bifunctional prephenate dehydrogenase/3-phosphoshikimate 1-carboxyvinyltransferase n=1 Tax=Sansalvadorimonas verongulae TaxID=2172824 RepID=UPI0012BD7738|nr:bifunctional prephenate dehydrogenase/3-phosphoshikimate 1-carboxyvinyltransferase [Sansalvadorimonas verongulae]MTI14045.1 bifunctional prephenate dehydrogenase/3-phosphoshikimate 1-carboxyvinyltransferase [Sansalvadorimonas verongulae]
MSGVKKLDSCRVLIVGLGLIGGSLAAALKARNGCREVLAWDRDPQSLILARERDVIDRAACSLEDGVADADIVVLAVPVLAMSAMVRDVARLDLAGKVVTDVGSCKSDVVEVARECLGDSLSGFVPGHPIAGSEKSGITAAKADLYEAHKVIVTPLPENTLAASQLVRSLWEGVGALVLEMDVEHHDQVLARTSHLPHLLAFSLVDTLAGDRDSQDIFRYAAGGFRDFTRIAASDPTMWHDVFVANRNALLEALDEFSEGLQQMYAAVEQGDSRAMTGIITRAKSAREHFTRMLESQSYLKAMSHQSSHTFLARSGGTATGTLRVPGDKSISHRSIMLGALADGVTEVTGFLEGEDALATLQAFRDMGVVIEGPHDGRVTIYGVGLNGLQQPPGPLYLGNAGTAMRLMAGLMAAQKFDVTLTGDESLSNRPMNRVVKPLLDMGADIETSEGGKPPLVIRGGRSLSGVDYNMPMASAQVKSCLLLAGLYAEGETAVVEPGVTRDHTERMLTGLGYPVKTDGNRVSVQGGGTLTSASLIEVPADISSAAFFLVAASIAKDAELLLTHVGINPTRTGVLDILRLMGANITLENEREVGGEPVADIRVKSAQLKGIEIPEDLVPLAIDEFPVLFVAASCAEGETVLKGAEELRVKESDRIQSMADGLNALGVDAVALPDGMKIPGCAAGAQDVFAGGVVHSHGDHRIAMAFAVASLRARDEIRILDCANVATSFPNFIDLAHSVGLNLSETES